MKWRIRKGDKVKVIAGADKGRVGTVLEVNRKKMAVKVEGCRLQTHYTREGLVKKEGYIHYSNVQKIQQ